MEHTRVGPLSLKAVTTPFGVGHGKVRSGKVGSDEEEEGGERVEHHCCLFFE
jgi:hypothetical protein